MNRRIIKQFIYGGFFLAIIFLIGFGIYWIFSSKASCFDNKQNQSEEGIDCGGPCVSCGIKYPKSLNASWVKTLPAGENKIIAVSGIENPNVEVGSEFSYTINIFSKDGAVLKTLNNDSFIYAGEKKYLVDVLDADFKNIDKAEISFSSVNFKPKRDFSKPKAEIREFKTEIFSNIASSTFNKFTRELKSGMVGSDVKNLQNFLKFEGFFSTSSTTKFGAATRLALTNYQKKNEISPVNGYLGYLDLKTRNHINFKIDSLNNSNASGGIFPISVNGVVTNNDVEKISKAVIVAILRDKYGLLAGASKIELENIMAAESRDFKILFPSSINVKDINPTATEVYLYPHTN
ncbi:MAG: peptidoglycan-binding protein [Candidatus Wolfebacteria bacterium]|nr:peptidoglycan-binding protein [Candidatus Wolfebacteria bacterium]